MKNILKKLVAPVVATLLLTVIPALPAHAASNGLGITPRKNYTLQPGAHVSDTLYVNNLSQTQPLTVALRLVDFSAKDQTGSPNLNLTKNAPQTPWSVKPFVSMPSTVDVPAGKAVNVPITVSVPANQGAGSYYSAIEYTAQNSPGQQNVTLAASSVSLMFVTVPGHAHEYMQLKQFGAFIPTSDDEHGNFSSWFFTSPPKVLAYVVQNQGNVAEEPTGSIAIKNMFGKQVKLIDQANPKKQLALIDQLRRFEACVNPGTKTTKAASGQDQTTVICNPTRLMPGRYTAELAVFYGLNGNTNQEITATAAFWYLPIWFLIVVFLVLFLVVSGVYFLQRKLRRSNRKPGTNNKSRK
ncbi:MAG TPA: hypothetical protein VJR27_01015 [Candidatus Saccharimonadales bacterium]|nr:hypothetical protein [Candidatus Saccharimonadales bacterium]